ncbi:peroxisomal membrane protein 2 [Sardina pilchardus]|uniref:peroxisomal membrane protein 2 n=1 Tax=Sardina pilchardus TaxID=27697 RepID=UPI002E12D148
MSTQSLPVARTAFPTRLLQQYTHLLRIYPVITKSVTSGILSAFGNLLSQGLEARKKTKEGVPVRALNLGGLFHYALYGLCVTGPVSHYYYQLVELLLPASVPFSMIKRLLLDRLIFAPAFLLLFFSVMTILERKTRQDLKDKMTRTYWPALKMNWWIWTPFQFLNINFVPVQFRVLFANMVAFFWYAYLASVRK